MPDFVKKKLRLSGVGIQLKFYLLDARRVTTSKRASVQKMVLKHDFDKIAAGSIPLGKIFLLKSHLKILFYDRSPKTFLPIDYFFAAK